MVQVSYCIRFQTYAVSNQLSSEAVETYWMRLVSYRQDMYRFGAKTQFYLSRWDQLDEIASRFASSRFRREKSWCVANADKRCRPCIISAISR